MHLELREFAQLQKFLQHLAHIFKMCQRARCALVALSAIERVSRSLKPVIKAEWLLRCAINKLLAELHHLLIASSWNAKIGMDRNTWISASHGC